MFLEGVFLEGVFLEGVFLEGVFLLRSRLQLVLRFREAFTIALVLSLWKSLRYGMQPRYRRGLRDCSLILLSDPDPA